jgi:hypothetical protein
MDENEYFIDLKKYIARLEDELKVEEKEYERRLTLCQSCENLMNGMCGKCGCFVELRSVMKKNHCPDIDKKW